MKKKIWIGIAIVAVISIMVTISVLQNTKAEAAVEVIKLQQQKLDENLTTSGTLIASKQQAIYLQPDRGDLKRVLVKPGQKVKAGERLVEYDNPTLAAEQEQAEVQVKTAKIKLDGLYKQKKSLKQTNSATPSMSGMPSQSTTNLASSTQEIDQQIRLTKLELEQAEKQLELAKTRQSRLYVTSKYNGTVVQVNENTGNAANTEPLVIVAELGQLKVATTISEYDALKVKEGQVAIIKSDAIPDKEWKAEVESVGLVPKSNPVADVSKEDTQVSYPVELVLKESVPMKLGSRLIVEITTDADQVKALPQEALKEQGDKAYVFIVENGKAVQKEVKVGRRNSDYVEILSGITADQEVILKPSPELTSGTEVKVK